MIWTKGIIPGTGAVQFMVLGGQCVKLRRQGMIPICFAHRGGSRWRGLTDGQSLLDASLRWNDGMAVDEGQLGL